VSTEEPWYAVRCVFVFGDTEEATYEERVTLWRAESFEAAIAKAEAEAARYAKTLDAEYSGFAQAYHLSVENRPLDSGDEIFSLMRDSTLAANEYVSRYFDTGAERQQTAD